VSTDRVEPGSAWFDLDRPWQLSERVALRPERFGALAYDFSTRRLSFLKSPKLLRLVESLIEHPTGRDAARAAGVAEAELPVYERALATLAHSGMITLRSAS
jgi:putative mycofactocin binding protein MftB